MSRKWHRPFTKRKFASVTPIFLLSNCNQHDKIQLFAKFKKNSAKVVQSHHKFSKKFKVALNPLLITYSNSQRKTHQIAQIRHSDLEPQKRQYTATEVLFTFILSFNLDIPRCKFTILRLFNILPYISLYFEHKQTHCLCECPVSLSQAFSLRQLDLDLTRH